MKRETLDAAEASILEQAKALPAQTAEALGKFVEAAKQAVRDDAPGGKAATKYAGLARAMAAANRPA